VIKRPLDTAPQRFIILHVGTCQEVVDDGRQCRRKAVTAHNRCGKCHALNENGKQCSKLAKASGKYCLTYHDESSKERAIKRPSRRRQRPGNRKSALHSAKISSSTKRTRSTPNNQTIIARNSSTTANTSSSRAHVAPEPTQNAKDQAAKLCANALVDHELSQDFQDKITDIVSESVVERLTAKWDGRQCKKLAKAARKLLMTRNVIRQLIAYFINRLMLALGYSSPARIFVCELVCRMPVPWYSKVVAAARVIQLSGICLCYSKNRQLTECECMVDLLRYETKEGVRKLMAVGFDDWHEIAERMPSPEFEHL
jgi:hypothetical protein